MTDVSAARDRAAMCADRGHDLPIEVFALATGLLFDETRARWRELEARDQRPIRAVRRVDHRHPPRPDRRPR